jgi:hypothetical protein
MDHILTSCCHPARQQIWDLATLTWPYGEQTWPPLNLGTALGCGLLQLTPEPHETNQRPPYKTRSATRLLQILWSEATHLIWVLRCERVIQGTQHTHEDIRKRWKGQLNKRLTEDKITAIKIIRTKNAKRKTRDTWEDALRKQNPNLDPEWITRDEVF